MNWQGRPNPFRPSQVGRRRPNRAARRAALFTPLEYRCPCGVGAMVARAHDVRRDIATIRRTRCRGCGASATRFRLARPPAAAGEEGP